MSYLDKFTQALVAAIGFNDGANRGFWRVQWRDRLGRWAEMGRGVLSKVRMPNGEVMDMRGVFIGGADRPGFGRVLVKGQSDKGIPDGVYEIGSNNGEIFQAKLTDETLKRAGIEDTDETTTQERMDSDIPDLGDMVRNDITAEDEKLATDTPDDAQKAIIEEERAKSPLAKLPAGEEARMSPEDLKAVLEGTEPTPAEAPSSDDEVARLAVRKAFDDASFGEPVELDDMIAAMAPQPTPTARLKGRKLDAKPFSMEPGDIFTSRGEEYEFESLGERDRISRTQSVMAKNRKTGKSEEVILDTDIATPVLRPDKNQPAPTPAPAPANEKPATPKEAPKAPEEAPKAPEAPKTPEAPQVTETPEEPSAPEETVVPNNRADQGQDIELPNIDENTLWAKKVAPLRDKNGNKVRAVDPETGEYKSTFAEDPDAILNAILEKYPDAAVLDDGGIVVERTSFTDSDGIERKFESLIRRTKGSNYMVSYRITEPDGTQEEYFSHDFRDSFSSIHGKKNGIMRMSAILKGEQSPITNKESKEYKAYFASGKLEDRLKYFRGKHSSRATEDSLIANLKQAEARGKDDEIGLAQYNLDLLRNDFNGDINLYRKNASAQTMRLLTLGETIDKYATGRFYLVNNASGKSNGTVLRSAVDGIYGGMKDGQVDGVKEALDELAGRLPDVVKNPKVARLVLDTLRDGIKKRFPKENQNALKALLNAGYKSWTTQDYSSDALDSAPHVSWNGSIISPNMLVEYTNNNNDKSVGIVHSVVPRAKNQNPGSPNEYFDYIMVSFKGQDGKLQAPVQVSAKNTKVLDATSAFDDNGNIIEEAASQVTIYTPNLQGEEMRRARFGDKYVTLQRSRYADMFPGATDSVSSGFSPRVIDPAQYVVDDLAPGGYLYDSEGLPVGQIAGVRDTTSATGEKGFTFAHVDPNGVVGFTSVKAGVARAPKADISKEDGRGSSASDEGFTPNPADFQDVGLDAEGIGSEDSDADQALLDLVENSQYYDTVETIGSLAELAKLKKARYDYENSDSEESKVAAKETYKKALSNYYTRLAKQKAMSANFAGEAYSPGSIPSDSILEAADIASINGRIQATQKPFEASGRKSNRTNTTYDELVQTYSTPENTYSGYLPDGWSAANPKEALDQELQNRKRVFSNMLSVFMGDAGQVSDTLLDVVAKRAQVETNTDNSGAIRPLAFHTLTNATGDKVQAYKNPNGTGYTAGEDDLNISTSVINDVRSKLDIGDAPLTHVLINSAGAGIGSSGALGYVWTRDMWNTDENFANFHSVVDKINKFIAEFGVSPREEFVQGKSWFAVDISQDPELARRYVVSHELGHVMQGKVLRNLNITPGQREWDKLYGPIAESYRISQYGTSNYNEHFAESFARWELTGQADPKFLKLLADAGLLKNK